MQLNVFGRTRARHSAGTSAIARFASPVLASATALALVAASLAAGMTVAPVPAAEAATTPAPVVTLAYAGSDGKDTILAGDQATYTLTASNPKPSAPWFNLGARVVVPNGISFVSSGKLGAPVVYPSGVPISDANPGTTTTTVPAGFQVWVWEDVSDLPAGAAYSADITVLAGQKAPATTVDTDAAYFPVGSSVSLTAAVYASDVATLAPLFSGSTGVRTAPTQAATHSSAAVSASTKVVALHVTTDEPSPESELLRGVHDRTTQYTVRVKNTTQGATDSVVLVEYLPAGLEFLGCGGVDNSVQAEYDNSGPLGQSAVTPCVTPASVETVLRDAGSRAAFPAWMGTDAARDGVYTKVTWNLGTLAAGATRVVTYAAGIPLFENTLFVGVVPDPAGLAQASNLGNNTGPSTRHSASDSPATDGNVYTNSAVASGDYRGIVRADAERSTGDHDDETVMAMDLRILKSVDANPTSSAPTAYSGADGGFRTGYIAKYTLDLRASEYTDTSDIVVTDHIPNGLCPVLPQTTQMKVGDIEIPQLDGTVTHVTGSAVFPDECRLGTTAFDAGGWNNPVVSGAGVDWVAYDAGTGDFYLRFSPVAVATTDASASIVYPVLMRQTYEKNEGLTSAQDRLTNRAVFTASSATTSDAMTRDSATRVQSIADDSQATLTSGSATISKKVLPRDNTFTPAVGEPCAVSGYENTTQSGFVLGDTVCYELVVDFQAAADTRSPLVTDILPPGVVYAGSSAHLSRGGTDVSFSANLTAPTGTDKRITWAPSDTVIDGTNFVSRGSTLVIHVWGTVSALSVNPATLDKPQNLMKFQQENVHGDVFFLRDAVAIEVAAGLSLTKGVAAVSGSSTFAAGSLCVGTSPNCDHVRINEGDVVTYRVDVTGAPYSVSNAVVWDALPVGVTAADVSPSPLFDVVAPAAAPAGYDGPAGRSIVVWRPFPVAEAGSVTLRYTVSMPAQIISGTTYENTASLVSYEVENNNSDVTTFRPVGSLGADTGTNVPGGTATTDKSDVYVPAATIAKSVVGTGIGASADAANGTKATHGEQIDYSYSVTIPARTSIKGGVLSDDGKLSSKIDYSNPVAYTLIPGSASVDYPGSVTAPAGDFDFDYVTGRLEFPAVYDNSTAVDQTFTVTISMYSTNNWTSGSTLYNRARFAATGLADITKTASVPYVQASPQIVKSVSSGTAKVTASQTLTYSLKVNNLGGRPISYDTVVTDCVPAELTAVAYVGGPSQGTADAPVPASLQCGGTGTLITWNVGNVAQGLADRVLNYTAVVAPTSAGGATYANTAKLVGYALPGGEPTPRNLALLKESTVSVSIEEAVVTKTVSPAAASIGDSVQYVVDVALPVDVNFYGATITDPAPAGVRVTGPVTVSGDGIDFGCVVADGTISCAVPGSGDVTSAPTPRHVVLTYAGTVVSDSGATVKGAKPRNTATFAWRTAPNGTVVRSVAGGVDLTVVEPGVTIVKKVEGADANTVATAVAIAPGQPRAYSIAVANPAVANASTAFDVVVIDDVPSGLVVDPASVTAGGVVAVGGRSIRWTVDEIVAGGTVTLAYSASLVASAGFSPVSSTLASTKNVASVTHYYSTADPANTDRRAYVGGSDPAYVAPGFPHVTVAKAANPTDLAKVGQPFTWRVTLTNTGAATAKSVTVADTLPENWDYTATTSIKRQSGSSSTAIAPTDVAFTQSTLTWVVAGIPAGDSVVIVYTATPASDSYSAPGVGALRTVPHTNTAEITRVTDATDATGNAVDTDYLGGPATASAYLVATDVTITKSRVGTGRVNVGDLVDFTLTAMNIGGQPADGVTIVDTLPAGLTFDPARVAAPVTPGSDFVCSSSDSSTMRCVLTGQLAAGASKSVVVRAFVLAVASSSTSEVRVNTADITTSTPETSPTNNRAQTAITVSAPEVTIVKTGALPVGAVGAVGEIVSYEFTVGNPASGPRLTGVVVTDPMFPDAGDIVFDAWPSGVSGRLDAGQSVVAHASYAITQNDIDAGYVRNLATVTATPPDGADYTDSDTVDVGVPNSPSIELVKDGALVATTARPSRPGDGVDYSFTITNTGNVTLSDVDLVDALPDLSEIEYEPGFAGTLAPGASASATATYELTQSDIDAGEVVNTAVASGTSLVGTTVDDDDEATIPIAADPEIVLEKTATVDPAGSFLAGDGIVYSFSVRNPGNVTLSGVTIDDVLVGLGTVVYSWPAAPGVLAPGASATATATYRMTQADLDRGSVDNTATGRATTPAGGSVDSSSTATVKLTPAPAIKLTMTAAFAKGARGYAGDELVYSYLVTNRGNVTLSGMRLVSDLRGLSAMSFGAWPAVEGTLAPGESVTATASYRLAASDILAGRVVNNTRVTALAFVDGVTSSVADDGELGAPVLTLLAATGVSIALPVGLTLLLLLIGTALLLANRRFGARRQ